MAETREYTQHKPISSIGYGKTFNRRGLSDVGIQIQIPKIQFKF